MIVPSANLAATIRKLQGEKFLALDTETTGLQWFNGARLFSIIIASKDQEYYFDFNDIWDDTKKQNPLPREVLQWLKPLLARQDITWFMHNAKFDLAMLAMDGLKVAGTIHCTEAMARLLYSDHQRYNLAICLQRMNRVLGREGPEKMDAVKIYIKKHKLFDKIHIEGKKRTAEQWHAERVPIEIMQPYAEMDARGTYELGQYQRSGLHHLWKTRSPRLDNLIIQEREITKVCLAMQLAGIKLDVSYNQDCLLYEMTNRNEAAKEWEKNTGLEFSDSNVQFAKVFLKQGVEFPKTAKGNPSFKEEVLADMDHPLADIIKRWRKANKKAGTYYSSYAYYSSKEERIHADPRQSGTGTGRMSYWEPNLQNVPKVADPSALGKYEVRRCFVPDPGTCFFMPDYDQMEYRMMLDQAEEMKLINLILHEGLDVHTATAEMVGVSRQAAKTINFMLLYGGGAQKLADALGISLEAAKEIKYKYFQKLKKVKKWFYSTMKEVEMRGYTVNWLGRICYLPKKLAYKGPNYEIQGGCADAIKRAMVGIHKFLQVAGGETKMLLQIHDELLFQMPRNEIHTISRHIVAIMEEAYPHKHLPLTVSPKYSWKSWADYKEGFPNAT